MGELAGPSARTLALPHEPKINREGRDTTDSSKMACDSELHARRAQTTLGTKSEPRGQQPLKLVNDDSSW